MQKHLTMWIMVLSRGRHPLQTDFYSFLYGFNREEILHTTTVKFITSP